MLCLITRWLPKDSDTTSRNSKIQRKKGDMSNSVSFLRAKNIFQSPRTVYPISLWLKMHIRLPLSQSLAKGVEWTQLDYKLTRIHPLVLGMESVSFFPKLRTMWRRDMFLHKTENLLERKKMEVNAGSTTLISHLQVLPILLLNFPICTLFFPLLQHSPFYLLLGYCNSILTGLSISNFLLGLS